MPTLAAEEIYKICVEVGFTPDQAVTWTAIALAESGGRTDAHNPSGEDSWGLWQINVDPDVRPNNWGDLTDPRVNARAALEVSGGGHNMSPWTVTHESNKGTNKDYRNFIDDARAASGGTYMGDDDGVRGYGDPGGHADDAPGDGPDLDLPGGDGAKLQAFIDHAVAQTGDRYVFGAEADADDDNPEVFDCSELIQWSAGQVGVDMPDGSWLQYLTLKDHGTDMSVEEALKTPGALLFSFSSEPTAGGGRPSSAHVAISLGDGTTIEARGTRYGVGTWEAGDRFTYAAVIPELGTTLAPPPPPGPGPETLDTDADGLSDLYEVSIGTDPLKADTDGDGLLDGFEVRLGTDARNIDSDGDGLSDGYELSQSHTNPLAADTDADGTIDSVEISAGTDAVEGTKFTLGATPPPEAGVGAGASAFGLGSDPDSDSDGLTDLREQALGSNAADADSDHDGLADGVEYAVGTNLLKADTDGDGLSDAFELSLGTDPTLADTNRDGLLDGAALAMGADPGQASSVGGGGGGAAIAGPEPAASAAATGGATSTLLDVDGDGDYETVIGVLDGKPPSPQLATVSRQGALDDDDDDDDDDYDD